MWKKFLRLLKIIDCNSQKVFTPELDFKCSCSYHTRAQGGMGKNKGKPNPNTEGKEYLQNVEAACEQLMYVEKMWHKAVAFILQKEPRIHRLAAFDIG